MPARSDGPIEAHAPAHALQHAGGQVEARQRQRALEQKALPDVAVDVVSDLVRKDDFDFLLRVLLQHGVGDEDPACGAETGQRRVRLARLLAEPPLVRAEDPGPAALGEPEETLPERFAAERPDRVEQREHEHRGEVGQPDERRGEEEPGGQPPVPGRPSNARVHDVGGRSAEDETQADRLQLTAEPGGRGLGREAVPPLNPVAAQERERKRSSLVQKQQAAGVQRDRQRR